jgi:hypothetical protein
MERRSIMNIKRFFEKVERYMAAAAFAEEGDYSSALFLRDEDRQEDRHVKRPVAVQRATKRLD